MGIGVGAFLLIEALGYMQRIDFTFTCFGMFGQEFLPNQISKCGMGTSKDVE